VRALKTAGLFLTMVLVVVGATSLDKSITGRPYHFPDGWILGVGLGLAAVIGASLRARKEGAL